MKKDKEIQPWTDSLGRAADTTLVGLTSLALLLVGIFDWIVFGSFIFGSAGSEGGWMTEITGVLFGLLGATCVSTFLIVRRLSQTLRTLRKLVTLANSPL